MTHEELMALITATEAEFPVDEWTIDGLHVWPLVRYYLYTNNYYMYRRAGSPTPARRISPLVAGPARWLEATVSDREHNARLKQSDVMLFSDGICFSFLDGKWVERWCDSVADEADTMGLKSLLLTPSHTNRTPRHRPSIFIQPALDAVQIASKASHRFRGYDTRLPLFAETCSFMQSRVPSLRIPTAAQLQKEAHYCAMYRRFYEALLGRVRPKVVFVVSYYGTERMALLWACRRAGIPTADIQHGYCGRQHFAYGQWTRVPRDGYELLPSCFLVWGQAEHDDIHEWTRHTTAHRPIIGGHRFLELWRRGKQEFVQVCDRQIRALRERASQPLHILLTLNGLETPSQIGELSRMVASTSASMFWWIRTHPVHPEQASVMEAALAVAGARNAVIKEASELPLFAVLKHMNGHVTEGSTTCFDAAVSGVPSVLFARSDAIVFESLERLGWVKTVDEPAQVPVAMQAMMASVRNSAATSVQTKAPMLAEILAAMGVNLSQTALGAP